eukprot:CAMPEP_0197307348 /NCGR_PEP_ID=MMETSP0891-20130614/4966_1 /TAXON_ID=44058 ORGANISM="Aureoumbra lagunensis, Strain CCMP1510" /NCGR_SAMPLE_ID=MMETSP0891 /ASSEMBLY_ACC=CAM_ASM_000534 /LENGTH=884 /DNA_ID=CAMNT_0042790601 /DNA_START=38 /DNA_END=2692 /DNA_ORIENTATION=-
MDEAASLTAAARPFIDLIDTLRAHGVQQDLPLPQIAVMGDQSAGKSSVLEMISGVPFPRGSGLVTRCATQLIMKRTPPGTEWSANASVSWEGPQPRAAGPVKDRASLCAAIEQLTNVLCSNTKNGFSTDSIVVELSSPEVPDLTLLDLPGIVRTTVSGQDTSVVRDVNDLIESYLGQERTIVLAVMPANQDIATIDILERAARADPAGERTLAVLTKPDLIDQGAENEVCEVLANRRKPLRLGYHMVKCRSQRELDAKSTLTDAMRAERTFFDNHPIWSKEDKEKKKTGIIALTKRLSILLVERIRVALPSIKYELQLQRELTTKEFKRLGGETAASDANQMRAEVVRVIAEYTTLLRQSARGNYGNAMLAKRAELRLFGEAQTIFRSLKDEVAATQPRFEDSIFIERLTAEMAAFRGRELPGFTNSQVFYGFMVQNIEQWRPWVEDCRQHYVAAARAVSDNLAQALAPTYPALAVEIRQRAHGIMDRYGDVVAEKLDDVFAKESDPYTTNESMLELINRIRQKNFELALKAVISSAPPGSMMASNQNAKNTAKTHVKHQLGRWYMQTHGVNTTSKVEDMCTLLQAYWDVATKRLVDNVCMTLEHDFTNAVLKEVENECFLFAAEYSNPEKELDLQRLFREDPAIVELRRAAKAKEKRLTQALEAIKQFAPDVVAARPNADKAPKALPPGFFQQPELPKGTKTTAPTFYENEPPPPTYLAPNNYQQRAPPPPPPSNKRGTNHISSSTTFNSGGSRPIDHFDTAVAAAPAALAAAPAAIAAAPYALAAAPAALPYAGAMGASPEAIAAAPAALAAAPAALAAAPAAVAAAPAALAAAPAARGLFDGGGLFGESTVSQTRQSPNEFGLFDNGSGASSKIDAKGLFD